ncbi:MAG: hypothetical protein RLZZ301_813 [Bacteroidota bacterium]
MKWLYSLLLLSLLTPIGSLLAQKPSNEELLLIGKVADYKSNLPLDYAQLKLLNSSDSSFVVGAFTTSDGKFSMSISAGSYLLKVSMAGYESTWSDVFSVSPASKGVLNFGTIKLAKLAIQETRQINVNGQSDVLKAGIDKKIYNVAEDLNVNGGTANDVLNRLPSVEVDQDGGVLLRGAGGVTVLIDGRPSSLSGGNGKTLLDALPANSIERIEIVTNPSAKYDPDGTSGIINIVLKKNKLLGFNGMVSTNLAKGQIKQGNIAEGNVSLSYRNGSWNVYGTYNGRYLDGYRNNYNDIRQTLSNGVFILDQNRLGTDLNSGHTFRVGADLNLKGRQTLGFSATGNVGRRDRTGDLWNGQLDTNQQVINLWERTSYDPSQQHNYDLNANYRLELPKDRGTFSVDLTQSLGNSSTQGYYMNRYFSTDTLLLIAPDLQQQLFNHEKNNITTAQADLVYLIPEKSMRFETGLKAIVRDQAVQTYSQTKDNTTGLFTADTLANFDYAYNAQVYSAYAVLGQQIKRFKYQGGLRLEQAYQIPNLISDSIRIVNHFFNLFPSAHVRYELKPKSELSLSYSRRITRPNASDLNPFTNYSDPFNLQKGNPFLMPEYVHSFDLGYSLEKKKLSLTASTFYRNSTGVISRIKEFYDNGTSAVTFMNLAQTKAVGSELVLMFKPTPTLRSTFSYNANYTWYITNQASLPNRQGFNHNFKWNTTYEFWKKTASLQLSVNYNGPRVTVQGIAQRRGPIDLGFEKKLANGKWTIGTRVTDIFNRQGFYMKVDRPGIYQEGEFKWLTRRVYVSASYKFGKLEISNKSKLPGAESGSDL